MCLAEIILTCAALRATKDEVLDLKIILAWTFEAFAAVSGDDYAAQHG
jgi:hypothetical protein